MGTIGKRRNKEEERKEEWKNERKGLRLTGLLMEGVKARNYTLAKQTALPAAFGQNPQKRVEIQ